MSRAIASMPPGSAVRYCEGMPDFNPTLRRKVYRPAMLSRFVNHDRATLHVTFLNMIGDKADTVLVKRFFTGARVPMGGAVRVAPAAEKMGVATGVETTLSAMQKHGFPVWATLTDVALCKFIPPPECRSLVIFGDRDELYGGQLAAISLAHTLARRPGFKVRFSLPPSNLKDWNDVVIAERDAKNVDWSLHNDRLVENDESQGDREGAPGAEQGGQHYRSSD